MIIRIITIHFGTNYGSALQSYALCFYLNRLGHDAKIIDYIPERYSLWKGLLERHGKHYPKIIIVLYYLMMLPKRSQNRKIFENFLQKYVPLTKKYRTKDSLINNPPKADLYISGSDQIWNYDYNMESDFSYFLDFVQTDKPLVSYAASFGKSELSAEETKKFEVFLKKYSLLSVREKSGLNCLLQCDCFGVNVLDPTFLLGMYEWGKFIGKNKENKDYLLVYVMDGIFKELVDYADTLCRILNFKLYVISFNKINDPRIDKQFICVDPSEFISLIYYSSYVVTNSFHGTAFAINFKKNFIAVSKKAYNTRITCLLELLGIRNRFIENNFSINDATKNIDYNSVQVLLNEQKKISEDFLKNSINLVNTI